MDDASTLARPLRLHRAGWKRGDLHMNTPGAVLVAAGILLSRLVGFARLRVFAHYFGLQSDAADAFNAAFRIPNLLQNLFGEGALSASFIPVYASLIRRGRKAEADQVAGAVGAILALVVAVLVLVGLVATPSLVGLLAPGFVAEKRALTLHIVRILFPGAGLLVLSAWCLGILNSHRRFLLPYAAPIMWNAAMIATLWWYGGRRDLENLAIILAWGSVVGSALQLAVQVPVVWRVAPHLRCSVDAVFVPVREVLRNFVPVCVSRGVVQISAYIDVMLASLLPTGAVTGLANAQLLYTLPISLFGISVSAAELPEMSGEATSDAMRQRLDAGLRQIAFFVIPSAMAFLALGDVIAAAILQTGRFRASDAHYVWGILAGSAVGLLASTLARLYASSYYALRDTRTPLRYALLRVMLTATLGYVSALHLPVLLAIPLRWGAAGLTASAGVAGWVEMWLLRRTLNARIGRTGLQRRYVLQVWCAAALGAAVAWAVKWQLPLIHPIWAALLILGPYGVTFLAATWILKIPEAMTVLRRRR
jgi:putative peptidoglycan lipid II flippase